MKKILIIIGLLISCVYFSCKKYKEMRKNDLMKNPSYIQGRLFLTDTLSQYAIDIPLGGKKVTLSLKDASDPINYIYSSITNADGYFSFENLSSDLRYRISYSETVAGKLYLADTNDVGAPNGKLALTAGLAKTTQRGVIFTVSDPSGKRLPGADVCLFTSPIAAGGKSCDGSNYSGKTDPNGHAPIFAMAPGRYYYTSKLIINGVMHMFKGFLDISNKVEEVPITLATETPPLTNGIKFTLTDENNSVVSGGKVCLFTSKLLFARDTCEASNYSLVTGPNGKISVMDIPEGKYYILGEVTLKNFKLIAKDSVVLGNSVVEMKLTVKKR